MIPFSREQQGPLLSLVYFINPRKLVEKTINKSWKVELKKAMKELLLEQNENQQKEESEYHDVLYAP